MNTLTREQFAGKYGAETLAQFGQPIPEKPSFLQRTKEAFGAGVSKMGGAMQDSQAGRNPLSTGSKFGAGLVETAFSPITAALQPVIEPTIGKAVGFAADKISNVPAVQKFATSKAGEVTSRVAEDVGNLDTIAGAATMQKFPSVAKSLVSKTAGSVDDLSKQVSTIAREKAGSQPAKIMQRVARISKGKQAKFEQMAGEGVGEYLTKRGIYGNIDDISTKLYERFNKSKGIADDALAKLKGEFDPAPVKTMLDDLYQREVRVSSQGAPSPILAEVSNLIKKGRWNMSEINQIKRLYERNNRLDYLRQNLPEAVAKANNLDSAVRTWQLQQAKTLGLKNLDKINRETRLAKQLMDDLGKEYSGQAGNNSMTLTDWIMLSGGDPTAIAGFLTKKTFSSKGVQSAIAKALNKGKPVMGDLTADMGTSQVLQLPAGGKMRSQVGSGAPIKVAPQGGRFEMTGKQGITDSKQTKPQSTQISPKISSSNLTTQSPLLQEARKYKSAEEFVNSKTKLLHGTDKKFEVFDPAKMGTNEKNFAAKSSFFFTDSAETAMSYGKNLKEVYAKFDNPVTIDADGKMFGDMRDIIDETVTRAKKNGNDGVIIKNLSDRKDWGNYEPATHYAVFDTTKLKTKSQLTDIWNKANKK